MPASERPSRRTAAQAGRAGRRIDGKGRARQILSMYHCALRARHHLAPVPSVLKKRPWTRPHAKWLDSTETGLPLSPHPFPLCLIDTPLTFPPLCGAVVCNYGGEERGQLRGERPLAVGGRI